MQPASRCAISSRHSLAAIKQGLLTVEKKGKRTSPGRIVEIEGLPDLKSRQLRIDRTPFGRGFRRGLHGAPHQAPVVE